MGFYQNYSKEKNSMKDIIIKFNLREAGVGVVAVYGAVLKLHGAYAEENDGPVTWEPRKNFKVHAVEFSRDGMAVDQRSGLQVAFTAELRHAVVDWMDRRLAEGEFASELQDLADDEAAATLDCV